MTTGTRDKSSAILVPALNSPPQWIGLDWVKHWSGGDQQGTYVKGPKYKYDYEKSKFVKVPYARPPRRSARKDDHSYFCDWYIEHSQLVTFIDSHGYQWQKASWVATPHSVPPNPWTDNDDIKLIDNLRTRIVGTDFNPSVFLAEGDKAIAMIFDIATRVGKAVRFARKGNFRAASRAVFNGTGAPINDRKVLASNWLELQFGILPLLDDAYHAAQYLAHQVESTPALRFSATRQIRGPGPVPAGSDLEFSDSFYYVRKHITAKLTAVDYAQLSGLTDPRAAMWEVLPFSFVLDWFLPIQPFLQSLATAHALKGKFVISTKTWYGGSGLQLRVDHNPNLTGFIGADGIDVVHGKFTRVLQDELDVPLPSMKPLKKALSLVHVLDGLALLSNQLKSNPDPSFRTAGDISDYLHRKGVVKR